MWRVGDSVIVIIIIITLPSHPWPATGRSCGYGRRFCKILEIAFVEGDLREAARMGEQRSGVYGDYRSDLVVAQPQPQPQPQRYPQAISYSYSQSPARPDPVYKTYKSAKSKSSKSWSLSDPEVKRRKRVASYKVYAVEGRMKGSIRKSFRWLKNKYTEIVYGWW